MRTDPKHYGNIFLQEEWENFILRSTVGSSATDASQGICWSLIWTLLKGLDPMLGVSHCVSTLSHIFSSIGRWAIMISPHFLDLFIHAFVAIHHHSEMLNFRLIAWYCQVLQLLTRFGDLQGLLTTSIKLPTRKKAMKLTIAPSTKKKSSKNKRWSRLPNRVVLSSKIE